MADTYTWELTYCVEKALLVRFWISRGVIHFVGCFQLFYSIIELVVLGLGQCVPQTDTVVTMVNVGLRSGVKAMWQQQGVFHDFIIQVEDWEFKVHKVVLAATSKYFWAMFGDGFAEATKDKFELKGHDPYIMSKLLEFVYTGDEAIIKGKEAEVLECSMYFQMPLVSVFCVKKLLQGLTVNNCQAILATLREYSFHKGVPKVKEFIKANWKMLIKLENISREVLNVVLECWNKSEWELFLYIKDWVNRDDDNRQHDVNQLMSNVRFCLIGQKEVNSIKKMSIFCDSEGPWHDLVEKAVDYHKLPTNLKAQLKTEPRPVFFTTGYNEEASTFFALDDKNHWKKLKNKMLNMPTFREGRREGRPMGIHVNNFYVVCTSGDADQEWHKFNPQTLTWSRIAGMTKPRRKFTLVHHDEHLYVVGGQYVADYFDRCTEVQRYSFRTNTWSAYGHLPYTIRHHATSVLGDTLYMSGGHGDGFSKSDNFVCLNLSSPNNTWQTKKACMRKLFDHRMVVLRIEDEQVPVIIDEHMRVIYYSPSREDWFEFDVTANLPLRICDWSMDDNMVFVSQNSLFMLNFAGCSGQGAETVMKIGVCWEWNIAENVVKQIEQFPIPIECCSRPTVCSFGAVLALPVNLFRPR